VADLVVQAKTATPPRTSRVRKRSTMNISVTTFVADIVVQAKAAAPPRTSLVRKGRPTPA